MSRIIFLTCLIWLSMLFSHANAQLSVSIADIEGDGISLKGVALPYYYEGGQTSLKTVSALYRLPPVSDLDKKFYGVLIPYPIQGGQVFINGRLIHELERSGEVTLFNWYRPVLLNLSAHDLKENSDNFIEFRQVGHLRGWSILPLFFDEVSKLQYAYDFIFYLTQTLVETINYLCGFVGFFLIAIGAVGRQKRYIFSGVSAVVWVFLFKLALLPSLEMSNWFLWRLTVYCLTGNVIFFSILFLFEFFSIGVSFRLLVALLASCQLGWFLFLFSNGAWEFYLDQYWTGSVVFIYIYCIFVTFWGRSELNRFFTFLFFSYLLISGVFALHDFLVQAGFVFKFDDPLFSVIGNAVYLSHFSLPAFLVTACALLFFDYFDQIQRGAKIRDEILSDVHDGVGARLNVLLMGLELNALDWATVKDDVRRCIDELRFVLLPEGEKTSYLFELMENFCASLLPRLKKKGVDFHYSFEFINLFLLAPRLALILYFSLFECLSNVVKHASAHAREVRCIVRRIDDFVHLCVMDDGPGIHDWCNEKQTFNVVDARRGLGLRSLIGRVKGVNGEVCIESDSSTGTCIRIQIPIKFN